MAIILASYVVFVKLRVCQCLNMLRTVCKAVSNVHSYSGHIDFVQQNRIFYGNPHNKRFEGKKLRLSYVNVLFPTILCGLHCVRAFTVLYWPQCLDTPLKRLRFMTEILYPNIRVSFEICILLWTLYEVLYTVYLLRSDIVRFTFLAALVLGNEPEDQITPRDLGLYQLDSTKRLIETISFFLKILV